MKSQSSKKIRVAFLYNVRNIYPDPKNLKTQMEVDFDDPETIEAMIKNLKKTGFHVIPIEANEEAYLKLHKNKDKIDIAFNYSEGKYGKNRECHLPAMLEMLQIPFTGSKSGTQAIVFNKLRTKEILLANNIRTPKFQIFKNPNEKLSKHLKFPLIVKPVAHGSSAGIDNKSIVSNEKNLKKKVNFIIKTFSQEALVEEFLEGREFSVPMLGNPPEILSIIEPDHKNLPKEYHPIDSFEVKWIFEESGKKGRDHLICPAKINKKLENQIRDICTKSWNALGIKDYCRIDLRCDKNENPYILEINSPPGLIPPEISEASYFPLGAKQKGLTYPNLLKKLILISLKRYENSHNYK